MGLVVKLLEPFELEDSWGGLQSLDAAGELAEAFECGADADEGAGIGHTFCPYPDFFTTPSNSKSCSLSQGVF